MQHVYQILFKYLQIAFCLGIHAACIYSLASCEGSHLGFIFLNRVLHGLRRHVGDDLQNHRGYK